MRKSITDALWRDIGSNLAVDLANTSASARHDDLLADDLACWLEATGGSDQVRGDRLARLRTHVVMALEAAIDGTDLPDDTVHELNTVSAAAPETAQLERGELVFVAGADPDAAFLAEIAAAAIRLVGTVDRRRLRRCEASGCGHLFLSRRVDQCTCHPRCANRLRVAAHRERRRRSS